MFVALVLLNPKSIMLDRFNPETVFSDLRVLAMQAGTNLTAVCKAAGVPRNTPEAWKDNPPKSFVILGKLLAEIKNTQPEAPAAND